MILSLPPLTCGLPINNGLTIIGKRLLTISDALKTDGFAKYIIPFLLYRLRNGIKRQLDGLSSGQ